MKKKAIGVGIGIVVVIVILVLFTNIDELTVPKIEESISEIEFDTTSISSVTGIYAINTRCELALLGKEVWKPPSADHTQWFYDKFGDLTKVVTDVLVNEIGADGVVTLAEMERLDVLNEEFYEKLKLRVNPSLQNLPLQMPFYQEDLEEDPECAKLVHEMYPELIQK